MRGYLVIDREHKQSRVVQTLEEAALVVGVEPNDIEWWLEEAGIWEGERWAVADVANLTQSSRRLDGPDSEHD